MTTSFRNANVNLIAITKIDDSMSLYLDLNTEDTQVQKMYPLDRKNTLMLSKACKTVLGKTYIETSMNQLLEEVLFENSKHWLTVLEDFTGVNVRVKLDDDGEVLAISKPLAAKTKKVKIDQREELKKMVEDMTKELRDEFKKATEELRELKEHNAELLRRIQQLNEESAKNHTQMLAEVMGLSEKSTSTGAASGFKRPRKQRGMTSESRGDMMSVPHGGMMSVPHGGIIVPKKDKITVPVDEDGYTGTQGAPLGADGYLCEQGAGDEQDERSLTGNASAQTWEEEFDALPKDIQGNVDINILPKGIFSGKLGAEMAEYGINGQDIIKRAVQLTHPGVVPMKGSVDIESQEFNERGKFWLAQQQLIDEAKYLIL